jgi:hypothetical protein
MNNQQLIAGLQSRFPIIQELLFTRSRSDQPERLPPLIGLTTAITDPEITSDVCLVLPSRENVAAFTAVLAALSAAKEHFPELHQRYIEEGFQIGERVRVHPTGHVFEFGGFFVHEGNRFFRLQIIKDKSNSSRSFPIRDAVLLEKTSGLTPKGTGNTRLGSYIPSPIDEIIQIQSGGNDALLANEIMLVCTQREFVNFIESVSVCHRDSPEKRFLLKDVISWGVVNPKGEIEFRNSSASYGAPLIAVASRTEYIASACRNHKSSSPRVLIDGAVRIKDLQSFDDIVDFSKLVVIADHSSLDQFQSLSDRGCTVWKLPDGVEEIRASKDHLLSEFNRTYGVASHVRIEIISCDSPEINELEYKLKAAETAIRESGLNDEDLKALSIAYSRLIDLAAFMHIPKREAIKEFRSSIELGLEILSGRGLFMEKKASKLLSECYSLLGGGLAEGSEHIRRDKKSKLLELVDSLRAEGSDFIVVAPTILSADSARSYLNGELGLDVTVTEIQSIPTRGTVDHIILTGWPKSQKLKKLLDKYLANYVHALAYQFEKDWFISFNNRRERQLKKWELTENEIHMIAGIEAILSYAPSSLPLTFQSSGSDYQSTEEILGSVRKGMPARNVNEHDMREGKYVSFAGSCYGYMTRTHKIPKVTGLVTGSYKPNDRLPLETIDNLEIGDYILFRANDGSQKDLIRYIAELNLGEGKYSVLREKSELWKRVLLSLGTSHREIIFKLTSQGMKRNPQTIRSWINDPARIGPQDFADLVTIASCDKNDLLIDKVNEVWNAILNVRAAHSSAGMKLSKLLIDHLPNQLPEIEDEETIVELVLGNVKLGKVLIVQIDSIGDRYEKRPYWEVNEVFSDY